MIDSVKRLCALLSTDAPLYAPEANGWPPVQSPSRVSPTRTQPVPELETEVKLLKQQVSILEKENHILADKLYKASSIFNGI